MVDYMLTKMKDLIDNLLIYPENMKKNLELTNGLIFSQEVLLLLVKKGVTREESYELVQRNAMQAWKEKINFNKLLKVKCYIYHIVEILIELIEKKKINHRTY